MSKSQLLKRDWSEEYGPNVRTQHARLRESAKALAKVRKRAREKVWPKVAKAAKVATFWEA
eukprot:1140986-Prymnesium_polylepis.1